MPSHLDLSGAELVFAQKLASCDVSERRRALKHLHRWIAQRARAGNDFTRSELLKLWKGLYYCFWMQDQPLLQEQLADDLAAQLRTFSNTPQALLYLDTFLDIVGREWHLVDRWRMDKVLMLVRRVLRAAFTHLNAQNFSQSDVKQFLEVLRETVAAPGDIAEKSRKKVSKEDEIRNIVDARRQSIPEGLKYHVAAIYLDELDVAGAGKLDKSAAVHMLTPYFDVLSHGECSSTLFHTVLHEIFETILIAVLHERAELQDDGQQHAEAEQAGDDVGVQFDLNEISERFFAIGAAPSTTSHHRRKLYKIVENYRAVISGRDPFDTDEKIEKKQLKLRRAADRLRKQLAAERTQSKLDKKLAKLKNDDGQNSGQVVVAKAERHKPIKRPRNKFKTGKKANSKSKRSGGNIKKKLGGVSKERKLKQK